jgi:hypothetical protein
MQNGNRLPSDAKRNPLVAESARVHNLICSRGASCQDGMPTLTVGNLNIKKVCNPVQQRAVPIQDRRISAANGIILDAVRWGLSEHVRCRRPSPEIQPEAFE